MKDFNRLLAKGNFTPKERVLLLIADVVSKDKGEKGFLSEADRYALSEGWQPQNNNEVAEYNRLNQGWKYACYAELDAQTHYLQTKVAYQTMQMMLRDFAYNPVYSEVKQALDKLAEIKRVEAKEAIEIINKQRQEKLKQGISITETIRELAFELGDEDTQKRLKELHDDIDLYEHLDELTELITLYDKKDFETIAERVATKGRNTYTKEYQLFNEYSNIPTLDIAKRYAKANSLPFIEKPDEGKELDAVEELAKTLEQHAREKKTTVEEIIKQTCLKWISEGLLENGDTAITKEERELIAKWTESKKKAKEVLQGLIDKGELKTGKGKDADEIITGESLYNSGLDYAFIKEFKQDVDEYSPERGIVIGDDGKHIDTELLITQEKFFSRYKMHLERARDLLEPLSILQETEENGEIVVDIKDPDHKGIKDSGGLKKMFLTLRNDFVRKYEILLAFEDLFKRISKAYEMDLTYKVSLWIKECGELVDSFNNTLLDALQVALPYSPQAGKKKHYKDKELFIDTEKIKPNHIAVELYAKELTKILGDNL